jgi:hypothetical protein
MLRDRFGTSWMPLHGTPVARAYPPALVAAQLAAAAADTAA